MTAYESITQILATMSQEFSANYELDEDGFLTLDWGGVRPVTLHIPEEGAAFTLSSSLLAIPLDKPVEPILRRLLEWSLPDSDASGMFFGLAEDDVFLSRRVTVPAVYDVGEFKRDFSDFMKRAASLDAALRDYVAALDEAAPADTRLPGRIPATAQPANAGNLSPEELLKVNLRQQNLRF